MTSFFLALFVGLIAYGARRVFEHDASEHKRKQSWDENTENLGKISKSIDDYKARKLAVETVEERANSKKYKIKSFAIERNNEYLVHFT